MSTRTRVTDGSFQPPDDGGLVELVGTVLSTMQTLASALRPTGPGGRHVTKREARRLLREGEEFCRAMRRALGEDE